MFQPAPGVVKTVFFQAAFLSAPRLFPVNERQEAVVAPDHLGLYPFPLPPGQELDKALSFADGFRSKAPRPQAIQGELDPGRIF